MECAVPCRLDVLHEAVSSLAHSKGQSGLPESTAGGIEISRALAFRVGLAVGQRPPLDLGARFGRDGKFQLGFHGLNVSSSLFTGNNWPRQSATRKRPS